MALKHLLSSRCCGGPIIALAALCLGLGLLFLFLAAEVPGVVFMLVAALAMGSCVIMSRSRCQRRVAGRWQD